MALRKVNFNETRCDTPEKPKREFGHGRCSIYGCTRMGHFLSGSWNCRYHDGVAGNRLSDVTMRIKNHELEINWYEQILQSTFVDYAEGYLDSSKIIKTEGSPNGIWEMNKIALGMSPEGMQPNKGEEFVEYRKRMSKFIASLLKPVTA